VLPHPLPARAGRRGREEQRDPRRTGAAENVRYFDIDDPPELYVRGAIPGINAFTIGLKRPFIVFTPGLISLLDENELRFVIGHELGHVLSGHALYQTMGHILTSVGSLSSIPGVGMAAEAALPGSQVWLICVRFS